MAFNHVLVPVDYSEPSRRALELALTLGAPVTVIHAWDRPSYVGEEVITRSDGSRRSLSDLIRDNAEREMTEFLAGVSLPAAQSLDHHLVSGEPASAILAEAGRAKYDLMVVGTHGRSGVTKLLLGSVTDKLIRLSPIPVLTVPTFR